MQFYEHSFVPLLSERRTFSNTAVHLLYRCFNQVSYIFIQALEVLHLSATYLSMQTMSEITPPPSPSQSVTSSKSSPLCPHPGCAVFCPMNSTTLIFLSASLLPPSFFFSFSMSQFSLQCSALLSLPPSLCRLRKNSAPTDSLI